MGEKGISTKPVHDDKPTFIYGLVDPRDNQLRYIGKTVLAPDRRAATHKWRARVQPHKRHSMAWILNLESAGLEPEVFTIEVVAPGDDWVDAEQFWISYFRFVGADLCNHTVGGEGQCGYKQPREVIARRVKRGAQHHQFGKSMPDHVKAALASGNEKLRADPERSKWAAKRRREGMTPEALAPSIAGLKRAHADPVVHARSVEKATAARRLPDARASVGKQSRHLWRTKREVIIAAQNAGKGEEWRRKQSIAKKRAWSEPDNNMLRAMIRRRRLSSDDVAYIRSASGASESNNSIAKRYGVSPSLISAIRAGRRRIIP